MSYYAPFMQPINYYNPNIQNGVQGQNYVPQGYVSQQTNIPQQNVTQSQQVDSSMIWVLGKNEAESYPVAPNCQVVLWDKNAPTLYVKSMSANGVPNMRILDFTERTETAQNQAVNGENNLDNKFVGIADFNALRSEFEDLRMKYNELERMQSERNNEKTLKTDKKTKGGEE